MYLYVDVLSLFSLSGIFWLWNICHLILQLTINLLPVNHAPFFPLVYYIVRNFLETASVGELVTTGKVFALLYTVFKLISLSVFANFVVFSKTKILL